MAKLNTEEFKTKYSERIVDNDELLIELMEDITDSLSVEESEELETIKKELEDAKAKYTELLGKYKERFLSAVETPVEDEEIEELKEEEVIDVKEI